MKKVFYLSCIAMIASSCAVGTYNPMARNNFGAQTTVVLDKANFRVVRDVEAVVEVNNTNLKRQDVEKSAYGELLRNARLTGSQVLINVVVEEIRRENTDIFRALFRIPPQRKQYVAARATVIEFLKDNGEPISSVSKDCSKDDPDISVLQEVFPDEKIVSKNVEVDTLMFNERTVSRDTSVMVNNEDIARLDNLNRQKDAVYQQFKTWDLLRSDFYINYIEVYEYLYENPSKNNLNLLEQIQDYANKAKNGLVGTQKIGRKLREATSITEKIRIFTNAAK